LEWRSEHAPESLMLPPRSRAAASPPLPEPANRGIAYALLAMGLAGMVIELLSATFAPRLVLFLTVLAFGAIVLVRCRRTERRAHAALLVTAISCGSPSPGSR
jgi:hypothetical protein